MIRKILIAAAAVFTIGQALPLMAEYVFLKDGSFIEGSVISDTAAFTTVRTTDNKQKKIARDDIMRIVYKKLKMNKIYIQKRDGKGVVAFLMDEDRDKYTFRLELNKPEEFDILRDDILFMSEKNPSGLQTDGDIGTDRVNLKWLPPYDKVKEYRIYIKKNAEDKYELADSTSDISATIKKLSCRTTYYLIVTAVDTLDNESGSSNELKITTKNIPPDRPHSVIKETAENKLIIKWNAPEYPYGKVMGYNIYKMAGGDKREKIAKVDTPEFTVPDDVSVYRLEVSAFDDLGDESSKMRVLRPLQIVFSASPAAFFPDGKFSNMYEPGYGGTVNIGLRNLVYQNFEAGLSASYIICQGKKEVNIDSLTYIPAAVYTGYHLRIGDWFSFFPFVKGGYSFSKVKYTGLVGYTGTIASMNKTIADPVAAGGIALSLGGDDYTFSLGADYGILYENTGILKFYEGFACFGILFDL